MRGRHPWWRATGGASVSSCQLGCGGVRPEAPDFMWLVRVIANVIVGWCTPRSLNSNVRLKSWECAGFYRRVPICGWHGVVFRTRLSGSVFASLVRVR